MGLLQGANQGGYQGANQGGSSHGACGEGGRVGRCVRQAPAFSWGLLLVCMMLLVFHLAPRSLVAETLVPWEPPLEREPPPP